MTLPPIGEHRFVVLFGGGHVFPMVEFGLSKSDDHGCVVNLLDCIKDSAMNRVDRGSGIIFGWTDFQGTDRGIAIVCDSCSCRMFNVALLVLTLGVAVFDAITGIGRLLRVGRTSSIVPGSTYV